MEWIKEDKAHCNNNSKHDIKLKNLEECQKLCVDDCTGVSFSNFSVATTGASNCYFCKDNTTNLNTRYDVYQKKGEVNHKFFHIHKIIIIIHNTLGISVIYITIISRRSVCRRLR